MSITLEYVYVLLDPQEQSYFARPGLPDTYWDEQRHCYRTLSLSSAATYEKKQDAMAGRYPYEEVRLVSITHTREYRLEEKV